MAKNKTEQLEEKAMSMMEQMATVNDLENLNEGETVSSKTADKAEFWKGLNVDHINENVKTFWDCVGGDQLESGQMRDVTTQLLENQMKEGNVKIRSKEQLFEYASAASEGKDTLAEESRAGDMANWDPILLSMVRRSAPSLVSHRLMGVQPMTGPTGLIFSIKGFYGNRPDAVGADANEALGLNAPRDDFTTGVDIPETTDSLGNTYSQYEGTGTDRQGTRTEGNGKSTAGLEQMGVRERNNGTIPTEDDAAIILQAQNVWPEMSFRIDKVSVETQARMLKGKYTNELTADLRAIHGLNARDELANMMSTELTAEMNRNSIATLLDQSVIGCQDTQTVGFFDLDVDADGRWSIEKYKGLLLQINREAHRIATETRRGVGNVIITSSNVVAALEMAGVIDKSITTGVQNIDAIGTTYAGMLNGRFEVYVDPYTTVDYVMVGYRGANVYDAGVYYCPYIPLQVEEATDSESFQKVIGFKTRYGMAVNPFIGDGSGRLGAGTRGQNTYYRKFVVRNL